MHTNLTSRQSEIINAAIKLIGEGGIQALTIKNLSGEIGVTESAIYRHFKSKTEVLSTLLQYLKSKIQSQINTVRDLNVDPLEKVKSMIFRQLSFFAENPSYATVILSDGLYKNDKILHEKIFEIMEYARSTFINIIDEGKSAGIIRKDIASDQMAFIIMGSVRLTVTQWNLSDFKFDLLRKGKIIFKTLNTLIKES
jgi:AcrR family transcriptional regulator